MSSTFLSSTSTLSTTIPTKTLCMTEAEIFKFYKDYRNPKEVWVSNPMPSCALKRVNLNSFLWIDKKAKNFSLSTTVARSPRQKKRKKLFFDPFFEMKVESILSLFDETTTLQLKSFLAKGFLNQFICKF
jgi:hypothetical protein